MGQSNQPNPFYVHTRNTFSIHNGVSNAWEFVVRMQERM